MSFDATRAAWAARRAGALEGAALALLVAPAMADMTFSDTGEALAGARGIAAVCGVSHTTVIAAQRELQAAGVVERIEVGLGSRPSRWRWTLSAPSTGSAQVVDNPRQRATSVTPATHTSNAKPQQWCTSVTPVVQESNEYQDQVYPRVNLNPDAVIVERLLDESGVPPATGPRRHRRERRRRASICPGAGAW